MEPLARYRERVPTGLQVQHRLFVLYADRIEVHFRKAGKAIDLDFDLATLRPGPTRARTRLRFSKQASITSFVLLMVIFLLLLIRSSVPGTGRPLLSVVVGLGVLLAAGIYLTYRYREPVQVAKFLDQEGEVAMDLLQCGPDTRGFEGFVTQIQKQIRKARREAEE